MVDNILDIHPYKLICDAKFLNDKALDLIESRLKELQRSVDTIRHVRRTMTLDEHMLSKSDDENMMRDKMATAKLKPTQACQLIKKKSKRPVDDDVLHAAALPIQVLRQLAISDFLTANELGRLYLMTAKSFISNLGRDFVYFQLCRKRWRKSVSMSSLAERKGYCWLFRALSEGMQEPRTRTWPALPEPSLRPADLKLIVSIHDGRQERISELLEGASVNSLLKCGKAHIFLPTPIPVGESRVMGSAAKRQKCFLDQFESWTATIHAVRLDKYKGACIHRSSDILGGMDGNKDWNLHFLSEQAAVELTDEGKELESRLREHDRDQQNLASEGISFSVSVGSTMLPCLIQGQETRERLAFTELKVEILENYDMIGGDVFNSEIQSKSHGVSALHLLEKIRGFD